MKKLYILLLAFSLFTTANAQIVYIPDVNFKAMLLEANTTNGIAKNLAGDNFKIDTNNDKQIQESEALNVSYLNLSYNVFFGTRIYDLNGIEKFINLTYLNCSDNHLSNLNVGNLINLKSLYCKTNRISNLDVSNLTNLTIFSCSINQISTLDVSKLTKLTSLRCSDNRISTLDVKNLTNLFYLDCSFNQISILDVSNLINLISLDCITNQISTLDVNNLINLTELDCYNNNISNLDVSKLINLTSLTCFSNKISNLDISNLTNLYYLFCSNNKISSLDVSSLINLVTLRCSNNQISTLDVSKLINLISFDCSKNLISNLDVSKLINITSFDCSNNLISNLDVSKLNKITQLGCANNQISNLDVSKLSKITQLDCANNQISNFDVSNLINLVSLNLSKNLLLESLFIKNNNSNQYINFSGNPSLKYICVDEKELVSIQKQVTSYAYSNCQVNSYCSFVPGGTFYTIVGNQIFDSNNNGCDNNDYLIYNLKYTITSASIAGIIISDTSGNYSIPVQAGIHIITPVIENPRYFTFSPTTVKVTFPTQTSPFIQNFCITPNGVRPDLEVTLLPLQPARPGFDAKYKLVYKNKGNTIQSGSVNLTFNDAILDFVAANPVASIQTTNNLSWNFTNLQPFETREITFTMNVNSPMETPAVNNGDILAYSATISSVAIDETPTDNTFAFNQTVVGSYDPNDKTCLEGSVITPNLIGQYVHYTIRFENTGTFAAENVVVKDMIDLTKFDISTLIPTSASHSYTTRISEGNKVEFIFENINLPFDDANNDGYIAFKIKTKPTLVVNDSFSNEASIFFDYNFPIVTNKATSTFKTLGTPDFDFDRYFSVYPNPTTTVLNITTKESINIGTVNVYNTLGQLVLAIPNAEKVSNVDVSNLKSGNYFIQIKTDKGSSSSQFVKE